MSRHFNKGNVGIAVAVIVVLAVVGGVFLFKNKPLQRQKTVERTETTTTIPGYSGRVLAGKSSPYLEFNQTDYEKALRSGKVVFLDFFANWCPVCRAEAPDLKAGFDSLATDRVVGFRVNWGDSDTDEDEKKLAQQFVITYQHTKVILKDGKKVYGPAIESWDKEKFLQEINKVL